MGENGGGETTSKKQSMSNSATSPSPPRPQQHHHPQPAAQESSTDPIAHHNAGVAASSSFLTPPLYTNIIQTHISPPPSSLLDQNHQLFDRSLPSSTTNNNNTKRPRYTAAQWKVLPSPSKKHTHSQKQATPSNPPMAAAASSSDTAASSPGQECTNLSSGGDQPKQQTLQMRKGKVVSPPWQLDEMLWLARAWRIQYDEAAAAAANNVSVKGRTGTKTRAQKDEEVSEYLKRHGVNRDPKIAGTKWDNLLGDFRRVYRWERCGGRDQTGRTYFRLSTAEKNSFNLPTTFDEQLFDELSEFMGSRVRATLSTSPGGGGVFDNFSGSDMVIRPPPPPISRHDHVSPLTARGKQIMRGDEEAFGSTGNLLRCNTMSCSELRRIGKVRMIWEECVSLWGEDGENHRGRVKLQGLSFLNASELSYLDESMVACTLETYEEASPLRGFSVDRFISGQQLKVFGRRNFSSSSDNFQPPPPPAPPFTGFHNRMQLLPTEPSMRAIYPWESQDPTEYYLGCLKIPPPTLPTLVQLSWHLQEPPPEELRFPLRKDVYRDLPPGKEFFFTTSSELLDCRAITYDILSPIIRSNPSLTAATATNRESFISLWDDCINRLISKFCSLEMVFVRKPSSVLSADDSIQDQWPNLTAFVRDFCLWRGEETDRLREAHVDPANLIVDKLSWTYMNLPYVLGYYAVGYIVTFCAFSQSQDGKIMRTDLYTLDLSTPSERMKALIPCWRIAGLLPLLAEKCLSCINNIGSNLKLMPYSDFKRFDSGNGEVVEMTPNTMTRYFSSSTKWYAVKEIYSFLDQRIPHSETICRASEKELALTFKPRGCKFKPVNCEQLIEALKCVTEALVALHDLSFMHRDLGWDKVVMMRRSDNSDNSNNNVGWFLRGFEEAVASPQIYPYVAASSRHAPEMGRGMHGVKVDVWGVGQLVKSCGLVGIPKLLRELQNRCLDTNPEHRPTAADCYHHLMQLHSSMPTSAAASAVEYNV